MHPCYGATHEAYCGKCWESIVLAIRASNLEDMQAELREECSSCQVELAQPQELDIPAEFEDYVEPFWTEMPTSMTFEEHRA